MRFKDFLSNVRPHFGRRYQNIHFLAKGGMAEVYKATFISEEGFSKDVVIKKILSLYEKSPKWMESFLNEAKIMSLLTHSNLVQVYDFGKSKGNYFLAMEYVEGCSLLELQRKVPTLPEPYVLWMGLEILRGLSYAHQKGILHRDLSPSNILISKSGEIKITDFGIAKFQTEFSEGTEFLKGKRSYMSPEQSRKEPLTAASDLYSLSLILSELHSCPYLKSGLAFHPQERIQTCEAYERVLIEEMRQKNYFVTSREFSDYLKNLNLWKETKEEQVTLSYPKPPLSNLAFNFKPWALGTLLLMLGGEVPDFISRGYLSLTAKPWGKVFVEGKYVGTTPLVNQPLPIGKYTILVSNPELNQSKKIDIQVLENKISKYRLSFQ
ncbi:MAG: serine/threonine protein kinase [Deltaproteobacteria bacterium]|nr:serine/threonine protein kinase [Deltaproteobacteria bacterium]